MGAYTEIVDFTVPSNTTSVVLDSFGTITKNDFVKIVATRTRASGATFLVSMFPNNETTATNYHSQSLEANGTSVVAFRTNDNSFFTSTAATSSHFIYMKLSENDRVNIFANSTRGNTSEVGILLSYVTSSGVTFSGGITSLTFSGNMVTGDRIQIYKLAAQKVADITVASNTTQVDISSLSIDKDSEYLLVSYIVSNNNNFANQLFINDNTTATNYYNQRIYGNGTSAIASRDNDANFHTVGGTGAASVAYTFIKLSNIGAYTFQSYYNRFSGSSSIWASNRFGSSTAENITSITKLNIKSDSTNGIGTGTRFELYKLYE